MIELPPLEFNNMLAILRRIARQVHGARLKQSEVIWSDLWAGSFR